MTQIKLPTSNKGTTKLVVASVGILALVSTLLWMTTGAPQAASHPQELRVRSAVSNNASALKQQAAVAADPPPPGTHRYEMILSQLKDEHGAVSEHGKVIIETYDHWAPLGVAHFGTLVANQFYDQCRFFRVVDKFVVQFGINGDPAVQKKWRGDVLKDDPVLETNAYGTITYATSGPNTRTVQLFINTNKHGNGGLDKQGFAPIGKIVEGMEFVEKINNEYRESPNQGMIQRNGNEYLNKEFPRLSFISSIRSTTNPSPGQVAVEM